MSQPSEREQRFADYLRQLAGRDDPPARQALATLRRGLGKSAAEATALHRYIVRWLPEDGPIWREEPYYTVAALFAWHPESWTAGEDNRRVTNLGASLARLAGRGEEKPGLERRFVACLNAHHDDLPEHLRHIVGIFRGEGIPLNWAQLLHDIQDWENPRRDVQRAWARAYWGRVGPADETGGDDQSETDTEIAATRGADA